MKKQVNKINIIDLEATCWRDEIPAGQHQEIIEIGIVVVDLMPEVFQNNNFISPKIESKNSILIKPEFSKVSEFCTELTTITQEMLDKKGISFKEAIKRLKAKEKDGGFDSRDRVWASWGDYDRVQFERNCKLYQSKYPFGRRHINIKSLLALFDSSLNKEVSVSEGLEVIGQQFKGTQHRGDDDAEMIAKNFIFMVETYRKAKVIFDHMSRKKKTRDINKDTKKCKTCNKTKLLCDFYYVRSGNYFFSECKKCSNKTNQKVKDRLLKERDPDKFEKILRERKEKLERGKCPRNHQWCNGCKRYVVISNFSKTSLENHGRCRRCSTISGNVKAAKLKMKVIEYMGGKCKICGFKGHFAVYDFHHRDPKIKEMSWSKTRKKKWEHVKKEIDKCDLLCRNCHREITCNLDTQGNPR